MKIAKSTNKKNQNIWKILNNAVRMDYVKSENYLKQNNITLINGCINNCKNIDGILYFIPNFCINDPYFEKEILPEIQIKSPRKLNLYLYDLYENKKFSIKVSSDIKGLEIKKILAELANITIENYSIRILFGGAEINDSHFLYQHKLQDYYTIHIIKTKL